MQVLAVSEVAARIGALLRDDPVLADVWVRGEIANLSRSPAGHYYFTLRDAASQIRCVLFRGAAARIGVTPERGAAVILHGVVRFYEPTGACEIGVDLLYPEGIGLARVELEALRIRLEAEGLFAPERKRPLPPFPRRIGLVTSDGGAVLHDVLQILSRRYPLAEVVLAPASVQGDRAATEVCAALQRLGRLHLSGQRLDVIILARGGGAEEDLAVFNDERVVRACFGSPVPIISAIGHETDVTLVDYVADLRAPTPSAAAELVAPDVASLRAAVAQLARRAEEAARFLLREHRYRVQGARDRLVRSSPSTEIARRRAEVEALAHRGQAMLQQHLRLAREQVRGRVLQLEALSPRRTLERGYAICTLESGAVIRSAQDAAPGAKIDITVPDGVIASRAVEARLKGV